MRDLFDEFLEELRRLARSPAVAGLCPTTEANLGDGIFDAAAVERLAMNYFICVPSPAQQAALGGAQLAVNAYSPHPEGALRLVRYLAEPEQMLERAQALGQLPSRPELFDDPRLAQALAIDPMDARMIIERAEPRPVTPVYSELSGILQIWLHRALTGQEEPRVALARAAEEVTRLLERVGLSSSAATQADERER